MRKKISTIFQKRRIQNMWERKRSRVNGIRRQHGKMIGGTRQSLVAPLEVGPIGTIVVLIYDWLSSTNWLERALSSFMRFVNYLWIRPYIHFKAYTGKQNGPKEFECWFCENVYTVRQMVRFHVEKRHFDEAAQKWEELNRTDPNLFKHKVQNPNPDWFTLKAIFVLIQFTALIYWRDPLLTHINLFNS